MVPIYVEPLFALYIRDSTAVISKPKFESSAKTHFLVFSWDLRLNLSSHEELGFLPPLLLLLLHLKCRVAAGCCSFELRRGHQIGPTCGAKGH